MNFQPHIKRTLLQAIILVSGLLFAIASNAQVHIAFTGHVVMPEEGPHAITMTIENAGDSTTMRIPRNGAFSSLVPAFDSLLITVSCPGFISKQIVIHTTDADIAYMQHVRFNVALQRQPADQQLVYAGPVGEVKFGARAKDGQPKLVQITQKKIEAPQAPLTAAR